MSIGPASCALPINDRPALQSDTGMILARKGEIDYDETILPHAPRRPSDRPEPGHCFFPEQLGQTDTLGSAWLPGYRFRAIVADVGTVRRGSAAGGAGEAG